MKWWLIGIIYCIGAVLAYTQELFWIFTIVYGGIILIIQWVIYDYKKNKQFKEDVLNGLHTTQ